MDETQSGDRHDAPPPGGVRGSTLLRSLSDRDLTAVLDVGRLLQRSRGQLLLRGGVDAVLVMLAGAAKEHRATAMDDDVVLGLLAAGDVAGLTGVLGASSDGDITALDAVQALLIPGRDLRALARERPAVALSWLQAASEQLGELRHRVLAFASTSTSERIAHRLVELAERFGEPSGDEVRIPPQLTQEELASWAGASRESAAKTLHDLRRAGIVATRRRSLTVLDLASLRQRLPDVSAQAAPETLTIDLTIAEADDAARLVGHAP